MISSASDPLTISCSSKRLVLCHPPRLKLTDHLKLNELDSDRDMPVTFPEPNWQVFFCGPAAASHADNYGILLL
jgi:hypothetical protein